MSLPVKIALRYVFSRKYFHFITVITYISVIGIMAGVAALITVMSIFNGFRELTEEQIVGFDPHIRIKAENSRKLRTDTTLINRINSLPTVKTSAAFISGRTIAVSGEVIQVINIAATNRHNTDYLEGISQSIMFGKFDLGSSRDINGAVIGAGLADRMKLMPGDTVIFMSPELIEKSIRTFRKSKGVKCIVNGLFQTNIRDYDQSWCFVSETAGMELFRQSRAANSSLDIRLDKLESVPLAIEQMKSFIPAEFKIETWQDLNQELFRVMRFERMSTFIILSLIIILAVFNVLVSLTLTVVEKQRDIAILKSFGATEKMIRKIFIIEGGIIASIGTFIGALLGLGLCFGQIEFQWFRLDPMKYIVNAIPLSIDWFDVLLVCAVSLLLGFMATIYPSFRASSTKIIQAIREE